MRNFLIIDTETANSIEQPLPYDIGYVICTEDGEILVERSYCVAEMFIDHKDLLQSAYFADKIPSYYEEMATGKRQMKKLLNIRKQIFEDMKNFGVTEVGAYNMGFDKRACNNEVRYETKSFLRWFFPYYTKFFCIWNFACNTILNNDYVVWAIEHNFVSASNNIITNAETVYKYLTNMLDFVEEHKGLDDVKIEAVIFAECYKVDAQADREICSSCWRKVQKLRKEMGV